MSCFCGRNHTSLTSALACSNRLGASQSAPTGNHTPTPGVRSVSPHQHGMSQEEIPVTSRLMGRRITPVGELARDRARATGKGLLRTKSSRRAPTAKPRRTPAPSTRPETSRTGREESAGYGRKRTRAKEVAKTWTSKWTARRAFELPSLQSSNRLLGRLRLSQHVREIESPMTDTGRALPSNS